MIQVSKTEELDAILPIDRVVLIVLDNKFRNQLQRNGTNKQVKRKYHSYIYESEWG